MEEEQLPAEDNSSVIIKPDTIQLSQDSIIDSIIKPILRKESHLSYSSISQFKESPRDFIRYKMRQMVQTDAMAYGAMVHCLVLEPQDFYNRYFVLDDEAKKIEIGGAKPGATNAYKSWLEQKRMDAGKRELVTTADLNIADAIAKDVKKNPASSHILRQCPGREVGVQWEYGNYLWKGFKDAEGPGIIADLKTVIDANPRRVERDIMQMGYYLQGAMYVHSTGDPSTKYYIIAVDKTGGVSCHWLRPELIEKGLKEYQWLVSKFSECILADKFDASYEFFAKRWDGIYDANKLW